MDSDSESTVCQAARRVAGHLAGGPLPGNLKTLTTLNLLLNRDW